MCDWLKRNAIQSPYPQNIIKNQEPSTSVSPKVCKIENNITSDRLTRFI